MHPTWSSSYSEAAYAYCISWRLCTICESSAVRIGLWQGLSLVLVEDKCRSYSYKGGVSRQVGQVREARVCGDTCGTTLHAHHMAVIWAVMAITWWSDTGVTGPSTVPLSCLLKARQDGSYPILQQPVYLYIWTQCLALHREEVATTISGWQAARSGEMQTRST